MNTMRYLCSLLSVRSIYGRPCHCRNASWFIIRLRREMREETIIWKKLWGILQMRKLMRKLLEPWRKRPWLMMI